MASKTKNLGLTLVGTSAEDVSKVFSEYRQIVNGETGTSNAELVDAAFGKLSERVKAVEDGAGTGTQEIEYYTGAPSALGTASAGTATGVARGDHVHPMPTAAQVGAVPTSRTVNGKALSSNVTLSASDVGAVPTTRTVNGKALSSNVMLTASDVSALPNTTTALKNPYALTINGVAYDGSEAKSVTIQAADGSGVTIDATLTQSGQAADAKAVGDALADKADASALSKVATSGSYNDLSNKPTIPAAYSLPTASATVLGGVKVGSGLTITNGVLSLDVSNANGVSF